MEIRKLRNPTTKNAEFMYCGQTYIVKAGTEESFPGDVVKHYTLHINGTLVESTNNPAPEEPKEEVKEEPKVEEKK